MCRFNIIHDNHHSWSLQIKDVQAEDRGYYMCQVRLNCLAEDRVYYMCQVRLNGCSSRGQRILHVSGEAELLYSISRGQRLLHVSGESEDRGFYVS
jgi:hypothetical protein